MNNLIILFLTILSILLLYQNFGYVHHHVDLSYFYPLQIFIYYTGKQSTNQFGWVSYCSFSLAYRFHKFFLINLYYFGTLITSIEYLQKYVIKLLMGSMLFVLLPFRLTKQIFSNPYVMAFVDFGFNLNNTRTIMQIFTNSQYEGDLKILLLVVLISITGPLVLLADHLLRVGKDHVSAYMGKIIKTSLSYAFVALSGIFEKQYDGDIQEYLPLLKDLEPENRLHLFMMISFSVPYLLKYLDFTNQKNDVKDAVKLQKQEAAKEEVKKPEASYNKTEVNQKKPDTPNKKEEEINQKKPDASNQKTTPKKNKKKKNE